LVAAGLANLDLGVGPGAASPEFTGRYGQDALDAATEKAAADAAAYAGLHDNAEGEALLVLTFGAEQEAMKLIKEGKDKRKAQAPPSLQQDNKRKAAYASQMQRLQKDLARVQAHKDKCDCALPHRHLRTNGVSIPLETLISKDELRIKELEAEMAAMDQPPVGNEVTATSAAAPVTPTAAAPVSHLTPAPAPSSAPCLVS
jgi:hypothetical protein